MKDEASPTGFLVPAAAATCVLLAAAELGALPPLHFAWATNLWQYLPTPLAMALMVALLALLWPTPRTELMQRLPARWGELALPRSPLGIAAFVLAAALVLWLLRERRTYGDSSILLYNAAAGSAFLFPDIGATFLFQVCHRLGTALGTSGQAVVQVAIALAGGGTVYCFGRVAELLAPSRPRALLFLLLVLGGGLLRVLAGHVEVYAFVLLCAGAYFWSALACLQGRCSATLPALAFGLGLWMHLLVQLPRAEPAAGGAAPSGRSRRRRWRAATRAERSTARGGTDRRLPPADALLGNTAELAQAWETLLRWSGVEPSPVGHEAFLRAPLAASGAGTRYAILSWGHVKYLANAFLLLVPAAVPIVVVFLVVAPRRFVASVEASFLSSAALFMLAYALIVRPVWGPYDWDLFSLTAATLACLAAYLLVQSLSEPPLLELAIVVVAGTLLLFTIPFLAIGIAPANEAGPFAFGLASQAGESPVDAFERQLGPWL